MAEENDCVLILGKGDQDFFEIEGQKVLVRRSHGIERRFEAFAAFTSRRGGDNLAPVVQSRRRCVPRQHSRHNSYVVKKERNRVYVMVYVCVLLLNYSRFAHTHARTWRHAYHRIVLNNRRQFFHSHPRKQVHRFYAFLFDDEIFFSHPFICFKCFLALLLQIF